jgi:hypothetical protein
VEEGGDFEEDTVMDDHVLIYHQYMVNPFMEEPELMHCEQLFDNIWVCFELDYFIEGNFDSVIEILYQFACADGTTIMSDDVNDGTEDCADVPMNHSSQRRIHTHA